jgi:hypothetical protein
MREGNMANEARTGVVGARFAPRSVALVALCWVLSTACAGAGGPRVGDAPAAYGRPQPDPSLRLTVQERLVAYGLERVVVKVAVSRTGELTLVEFLTPDLTPAAVLDLRKAFNTCIWKPGVGPDGEPVEGEITLLFRVGK